MAEWLNTPVIILAVLGVGALIWKIGKWMGEVDADRSRFKDFIKEIREDIKKILRRLPSSTTAGARPIRLTSLGKSIAGEIDADGWADTLVTHLKTEIVASRSMRFKSFPMDYAQATEPPPERLLQVYSAAYRHGVDVSEVRRVLGVVLRDKLLQSSPD